MVVVAAVTVPRFAHLGTPWDTLGQPQPTERITLFSLSQGVPRFYSVREKRDAHAESADRFMIDAETLGTPWDRRKTHSCSEAYAVPALGRPRTPWDGPWDRTA